MPIIVSFDDNEDEDDDLEEVPAEFGESFVVNRMQSFEYETKDNRQQICSGV